MEKVFNEAKSFEIVKQIEKNKRDGVIDIESLLLEKLCYDGGRYSC
jgi:hypothetical protein